MPDTPSSENKARDSFFIDERTFANAQSGYKAIEHDIPVILAEFYEVLLRHPVGKELLEQSSGIDHLKDAQTKHWEAVFKTYDPQDHEKRARRIGEAHSRVGLRPDLYLGGYALVLGKIAKAILIREKSRERAAELLDGIIKVICMDVDAALSIYTSEEEVGRAARQTMGLSDAVDREVESTSTILLSQASQLGEYAVSMSDAASSLASSAKEVKRNSQISMESVSTVASATEELESSSQEIASQISRTAGLTSEASAAATETAASVDGLKDATTQISSVVNLVNDIAAQTKLLALNATIEAARAGEAGRGFAVVANEVKSLAAQTETAISQISKSAAGIGEATDRTVSDINAIANRIREIDEIASGVASAVEEQLAATQEIARSVQEASGRTSATVEEIGGIVTRSEESNRVSNRLSDMASVMSSNVAGMQDRMRVLIRSSAEFNRRRKERIPIIQETVLDVGGKTYDVTASDISCSGILVRPKEGMPNPNDSGFVTVREIGKLPVSVIGGTETGIHLRFKKMSDEMVEAIDRFIDTTREEDEFYIDLCKKTAARASEVMAQALQAERLSFEDLFDFNYVPVSGTDPQQYTTQFLEFTDDVLAPMQDAARAADKRIRFCVAIDRNGYIGTHNSEYSKPQKPDDPVWNVAHSRNRRIFDDKAGMLAARNAQPHFIQTYARDMGGGTLDLMKEVDVPIQVKDRAWGNMRLAWVPE